MLAYVGIMLYQPSIAVLLLNASRQVLFCLFPCRVLLLLSHAKSWQEGQRPRYNNQAILSVFELPSLPFGILTKVLLSSRLALGWVVAVSFFPTVAAQCLLNLQQSLVFPRVPCQPSCRGVEMQVGYPCFSVVRFVEQELAQS